MRDRLKGLMGTMGPGPQHAGLAHERYAPIKDDLPDGSWARWFSWMEASRQPVGYGGAYGRCRDSLRQWRTATVTVCAEGRLLEGHGNASPTGVGLTLHHTWGVPVIPGSSLKGVLASYLRAAFEVPEVDEACRRLFGVPGDETTGTDASAGRVVFHDALWVSTPETQDSAPSMLVRDVLTVHQKTWYRGEGWPNDYDSPTPVAFLAVKPGGRFLVALSVSPGAGEEDVLLLRWATERLCEALSEWGVGGKTAAGYGRLKAEGDIELGRPRAVSRPSPERDAFLVWLEARREDKTEHRQVLNVFEEDWLEKLSALPAAAREECAQAVCTLVKKKSKFLERRDALLRRLSQGSGGNHGNH